VATIEHLMAALAGLGVDNVLVEIDGPEVPILDGSSAPFIDAIDGVGLASQHAARRYLKVLKPVRVTQGKAFAELLPNERGFKLDVEIDFPTPIIGRQRKAIDLSPSVFRREISRARTFGFMRDVEKLWGAGFALGASLDNTVAIGDDGILNPEGLRYADEFVRHKILDAVGDLSLGGLPILGAYRSYCGGHRMNFLVLEALFASRSNYAIVDGTPRRETGYAELGNNIAVPAFAQDVH
jgi:UDP-3-O-[3-hydroxymyristoyl] N-acetylglucosamine deacetylase